MNNSFNGLALSLESDTFHDLKQGFQDVLTDTLGKMLKNNEIEGAVTVKLKIVLNSRINDLGVPYFEPVFTHEITGAVQQKRTEKGSLNGEHSLEFDPRRNIYVLRPADVAQTKLDDYL